MGNCESHDSSDSTDYLLLKYTKRTLYNNIEYNEQMVTGYGVWYILGKCMFYTLVVIKAQHKAPQLRVGGQFVISIFSHYFP